MWPELNKSKSISAIETYLKNIVGEKKNEKKVKKLKLNKIGLVRVKVKIVGFEGEQMLIPYQQLSLNTNPKFSRKYYQKTRIK